MAISSSHPRPRNDDSNAWAVPWKLVVTVGGRAARDSRSTAATASPSDVPGFRLNEIVTAGSWPRWATVRGPVLRARRATVSSGTRAPLEERTYSIDNDDGSHWYWGATSMTTRYSLFGA